MGQKGGGAVRQGSTQKHSLLRLGLTLGVATGILVTGCTSNQVQSSSVHASPDNGSGGAKGGTSAEGLANVAYAGSLQLVNDTWVGPAFVKTSGYKYQGRGGGAYGVANLIRGGEISPNVFESIGTGPIRLLSPTFTDWAVGFASSPLVIAYSPRGPYAAQLKAIAMGQQPLSDLFRLMQEPGFHLGRTNPNTDPQGQSFILMMHLAQRELHMPAGTADKILGSLNNPQQVFSEEGILTRLQAEQLDAASAYLPEAIQRHLPYISLPDTLNLGNPADKLLYASEHLTLSNGKTVTGAPIEIYITSIKGTPDSQAGKAFVDFVLSKQGLQFYHDNGYTLTKFIFWGNQSSVPQSIRAEIDG